jgi:hypothetical protein
MQKLVCVLMTLSMLVASATPGTAQQPGMMRTLPSIEFNGSARQLLIDLCKRSNVEIHFDDDVEDKQVSVAGRNVTLAEVCTQVLTKSGYSAATDGDTIFVLAQEFDQVAPETAVLQMPIADGKQMPAAVITILREAQEAYSTKNYNQAKRLMSQALQGCYGVRGKEGYVYEIVRRFADIYAKEAGSAQSALTDFSQDAFLSRLLLRFMKRKAIADSNFDRFRECVVALRASSDPAGQTNPSPSPLPTTADAVSDNGQTTQPPRPAPTGSLTQQLCALEDCILARRYNKEIVPKRLERMEKLMFPGEVTRKTLSIPERVNDLFAAADPSGNLQQSASAVALTPQKSGSNWFFDPPPIPMLNDLGRGVRRLGSGMVRGPAEVTQNVLKSPLFWESLLLGGAAVGGYFLLRNTRQNSGPAAGGGSGHACVGEQICHICINCNYCSHCKTSFAKCGKYFKATP